MADKISISFKRTLRDQKLLTKILSMDDKSYELKKILYAALIGEEESYSLPSQKSNQSVQNNTDDLEGPSLNNISNF